MEKPKGTDCQHIWLFRGDLTSCGLAPQVTARAEHLGSGLLHQGCQPNPDQFIGVFAQNRPEVIVVLAASQL